LKNKGTGRQLKRTRRLLRTAIKPGERDQTYETTLLRKQKTRQTEEMRKKHRKEKEGGGEIGEPTWP